MSFSTFTFGQQHHTLLITMTIRRRFFSMVIVVFLCIIPFRLIAEERSISINFWPLFHYTSDSEEGVSEVEGLGPFLYWKKDSDRREWGFRPLLYWTGDERDSLWRLEFLYPFGKYQLKEGDKKGYLFPISSYRDQEVNGKRKWNFEFFPFFIGETEKKEDYFGVFPLFGTLLERYGKQEVCFYLWPLYSQTVSEGARTTNLLWPFFSLTEGETKKGYRFWPFYGQKEEFGVSKSRFFLWPIFQERTRGLDTEDPTHDEMIFPFYISKKSKNFEGKTFLWPFFSYSRNRLINFEQWDFPWPFYRSTKGENLYGIRIFILYSYRVQEGESKRAYILYPFIRYWEDRIGDIREKFYFIFFSQIKTSEDHQGTQETRSFRIWPFFDYDREETGRETFNLFYLFPFKEEGLERNLFPLFRIFRWEKDPQTGISANLFWGFYKKVKREGLDYWEIAHLIGLRRGQGWKKISFLKGLLLYETEGETASLRFFYLPFHLRWSRYDSSASSLAEGRREKAETIFLQLQGENENFTPAEKELVDER